MPERQQLVVAGVCVRYLATAARRAGYRVTAADGFGDLDTLAAARRVVTVGDAGADALAGSLVALSRENGGRWGLVYGGGFEGRPDLLARLTRHFELFGNSASTIALLADPGRFFSLLKELDIPTPEVRYRAPVAPEGWLLKHAASHGGRGVYPAATVTKAVDAPDAYFQRRVAGPVVSTLFAADGRESLILGFNRLASCAVGDRPFCYAGAINHAGLDAGQQQHVRDYARRLTKALGLRGINGLDLVLNGETPLLLELNPRPTATLELYDRCLPDGGLAAHVAACLGSLPTTIAHNPGQVCGCRVVYATCPVTVPELRWPTWCRDRPVPGARISQGAPICSLYARGRSVGEVERALAMRSRGLLKLLTQADMKAA